MDHTNKVHPKISQKSFSTSSKYVQEPSSLLKQERRNPVSDYCLKSSSSDKCDCPKLYMKKNLNIKTETEAKDDGIDYDVIKQFDELISELSRSDKHEEKSHSYNLCDLVKENIKNEVTDLNKKVSTSEFCIDNSVCEVRASENKHDLSQSNCRDNVTEHHELGYKNMSSKKRNDDQDTLHKSKENVSWIDSNLWSFGKEKQSCHSQKPVSKASKNVDITDLTGSSKRIYSVPIQPVNSRYMDTLNHPAFYSTQAPKRKDIKYSDYSTIAKNDYRFPPPETYLKEMTACKANFHSVKNNSAISLQNSPRISRTPVSKYMLPNNCFVVKLFVETRDLHLGPFPFEIYPKMTLRLLKLKSYNTMIYT